LFLHFLLDLVDVGGARIGMSTNEKLETEAGYKPETEIHKG